ncbi:hypothetical protein J6590_029446 [Homalodisca vitripennis]|nr:hypothetical protein J6590_029446 [Homalodisca vitripennis]
MTTTNPRDKEKTTGREKRDMISSGVIYSRTLPEPWRRAAEKLILTTPDNVISLHPVTLYCCHTGGGLQRTDPHYIG